MSRRSSRHDASLRRAVGPVLVAVALFALGTGALLVAAATDGADGVVSANLPVAAAAGDPRDITANNSPALARNPGDASNLALVNRIDTPSFSCALHVSFDAGATWSASTIPFPAGEELPERCFAPDVAFAADGRLHVSFVTLAGAGNVPNAAWVATSDDGGRTLGTPVRAAGPRTFQLRLAADPSRPDRLYLSWLQAAATGRLGFPEGGNPVLLARSDDGGASWSEPVTVSPPARQRVLAPTVVAGADGALWVAYLDLGDDRLDYHGAHEGRGGPPYPGRWSLVVARSSDAGEHFQQTLVTDALVPTERIVAFFPPFPSLAVDHTRGRLYLAATHGVLGDADVWAWTSTDGGASFGPPSRVNDTPDRDGSRQYLPQLAVAPDGRVDVVYYDRRADRDDLLNEVSLQSSRDGGAGFGPRLVLTDRAFDSRVGFGSERGLPDLGSRLGLLAGDRGALAVWADTRLGTEASNKQVLVRAVASYTDPPVPPALLRLVGIAALLTGVAILGVRWRGSGGGRERPTGGSRPRTMARAAR